MSKEYRVDKEYTVAEIIRYNLKMWWIAVIFAVLCAGALGGYKYVTLHPYVEKEIYENTQQVVAALLVSEYNDADSSSRVNNVRKIASSNRTYTRFQEMTGYDLTVQEYQNIFDSEQGESSDVVYFYVTFPGNYGNFSISEEADAIHFMDALIAATAKSCEELLGEACLSVLDSPYVTSEITMLKSYSVTQDDFESAVFKAITAGILLGIMVELVCYTFWLLLYRKPKNAEEIRTCLDADVIDVLKDGTDNEEAFKKAALFLKEEGASCNKINCLNLQCPKKDAALKLAMSYANEQKKTLYIDLAVNEGNGEEKHSISAYIIGEAQHVEPLKMNNYLDSVGRSRETEKGLDIAGNKRFAELLEEMSSKYECIVINSTDVVKAAEAYSVAKLCNRSFVVCGRKTVTNEALYRTKNTADVNGIRIDGVLVYEL